LLGTLSISSEELWQADDRIGLVITMSQYKNNFSALLTSTNDGVEFTKFLEEECKFKVTNLQEILDENVIQMQFKSIENILRKNRLEGRKTAVFLYYSGHGFLVDGFTVGITLSGKEFSLEETIRKISLIPNSFVMSLFDCCRTIPPKDSKGKTDLTTGQLHILHAVAPGKSALSRPEVNCLSEFTGEFLQRMKRSTESYPACVRPWLKYHKTAEYIDKSKFEFALKICAKPGTIEIKRKNIDKWSPEDIADWFKSLNLSKDYTNDIISDGVDGAGICLIIDEDLWTQYNILLKMDKTKITSAFRKLV